MKKKIDVKKEYSKPNRETGKAAFALFVAMAISVSSVFAWFATNRHTSTNGMGVSVVGESVFLKDTILVTREIKGVSRQIVYKRVEKERTYYRYDEATDTVDKTKPLAVSEIFPGETVSLDLGYKAENIVSFDSYQIYFSEIEGDFFTETIDGERTTERSILGIFKVGCDESTPVWMTEYQSDGSETPPSKIVVKTGSYQSDTPAADGYVYTTIKITTDLTQYYALTGVATNALAEKSFTVGRLVVATA